MKEDFSYGAVPFYQNEAGEIWYCLISHVGEEYFSFPKGHPEGDETIEETIKREIMEEAGLKEVKVDLNIFAEEDYVYEKNGFKVHKTNRFYPARVDVMNKNDTLDDFKHEIKQVLWLPYDDAKERLTYDGAKKILDKINNYLVK